jgi:hypothetical protein
LLLIFSNYTLKESIDFSLVLTLPTLLNCSFPNCSEYYYYVFGFESNKNQGDFYQQFSVTSLQNINTICSVGNIDVSNSRIVYVKVPYDFSILIDICFKISNIIVDIKSCHREYSQSTMKL